MNVNMSHASVSLSDEALTLREGENTVTIQLLSLLQYQYSASEGSEVRSMTLEVKALVWRCILSESFDLRFRLARQMGRRGEGARRRGRQANPQTSRPPSRRISHYVVDA
jgi:hypothetical protein